MSYRLLYFVVFLAVLLPFTACDKLIYDQPDDNTGNGAKVYLSVSTRAAQAKSGLRSSINETANYEDRVYNLAMLVFDHDSDGALGASYFNDNLGSGSYTYAFTVEMTPGKYDFYFIANVPDVNDLAGKSRDDINAYLNTLEDLHADLYKNATSDMGFPMARVYLNQEIKEGGTIYQPLPFNPKYNNEENGVVSVYSDTGTEYNKTYVELIRVVAKLEINFDDISAALLDEVKFHNAFGQYSLVPQASPIVVGDIEYVSDAELAPIVGTNTYIYYMPEALISSSTEWATTGNNKPVNYFSITTKGGEVYNVPIITSGDIAYEDGYLNIATGQNADYNIFRNHHYKFTIRIHQDIEIFYMINPWNLVKKQLFMGYGYNVEIDEDGGIIVSNTIDDCLPHKIRLEAIGGAYFGTASDDTERVFGFSTDDLSIEPDFDPDKLKTTYFEEYTINTDAVADSTPYLNIYYNGELVKTFTK